MLHTFSKDDVGIGVQAVESAALEVTLIARDKDVIHYLVKIGEEEIDVMANMVKDGSKLVLNRLHIGGNSAGKIGVKNLYNAAREIGRQNGATEVIINGGTRSTGKFVGQVPSQVVINVN
jgi:hypothetical protein